MAPQTSYIRINKVFIGALTTLCLSVLGSAAKAYMDVQTLKVEVKNYADNQRDLKEDLKEIKKDIKTLLSKGG